MDPKRQAQQPPPPPSSSSSQAQPPQLQQHRQGSLRRKRSFSDEGGPSTSRLESSSRMPPSLPSIRDLPLPPPPSVMATLYPPTSSYIYNPYYPQYPGHYAGSPGIPQSGLVGQPPTSMTSHVSRDIGEKGRRSDSEGCLDEMAPPKKKRRRQALSCTECKRRKIKCDRKQPCTPCTRRKEESRCEWTTIEPTEKYVTRTEYNELRSKFDQLETELRHMQARITLMTNSPAQHYPMASNAPPVLSPIPPGTARPKNYMAQMFILLSEHLRLNMACSALLPLAIMSTRAHEIPGGASNPTPTTTTIIVRVKWFLHQKRQRHARASIMHRLEGADHLHRCLHSHQPYSKCQARSRLMHHHRCIKRRANRIFLLARRRA